MKVVKSMKLSLVKQVFIFTALFFVSLVAHGQFVNAKLIYKDNRVQEGMVQLRSLPNNSEKQGHELKFKENNKAQKVKILSQDLKYILLKDPKGEGEYLLEFFSSEHKRKDKIITVGPYWYTVLRGGGEAAAVYYFATEFKVFKGKILLGSHTFSYYLKKESEASARFLAIGPHNKETKWLLGGEDTLFRDNAAEFFADYPQLAARIQAQELVFRDIFEIVDTYNKKKKR